MRAAPTVEELFVSDQVRWCRKCEGRMRFTVHMNWFPEDGNIRCEKDNGLHDTDYLYTYVSVNLDAEPLAVVADYDAELELRREIEKNPHKRKGNRPFGSTFRVVAWPPPVWPGKV